MYNDNHMKIESTPYFFFSYCHADRDPFLIQFFDDLRVRVANLSGAGIDLDTDPEKSEKLNKIGFRDSFGVQTGQDWMDKIGRSIQNSGAHVCLYSPNFFSRFKPFCGRELAAFLMRNQNIRYVQNTIDRRVQLQGARNILPVLWVRLEGLQIWDLPPYVLRLITWSLDTRTLPQNTVARYSQVGMRRIAIEPQSGDYWDILEYLAGRIIDFARNPLPPLGQVPDIETLPNAFWDDPATDKSHRVAPTSEVASVTGASLSNGPNRLLVIVVRDSGGASDWMPFSDTQSVAAIFEEVANSKTMILDWLELDPSARDFTDRVHSVLDTSATNSVRPIIVVDPLCLPKEPVRNTIIALLRQQYRAGCLVPVSQTDLVALKTIEESRPLLQFTVGSTQTSVRISVGDALEFKTAIVSVADDLLARIVNTDPVRCLPPNNPGPDAQPRISNRPIPGSMT
jgi:hypothetical protein